MAKKLARNVNINGVTYEAGTSVPKDIADQITNEKAWEKDDSAPERNENALVDGPVDPDNLPPNTSAEEIEAAKVNAEGAANPAESTAARKSAAKKTSSSSS